MKYCSKCKVEVSAPRRFCPLCKGVLTGGDGTEQEAFPLLRTQYRKRNLFFRVLIFISVCIAIGAISINLLMPEAGFWSLMVLLGEGGFWLAAATAIRRRTSISKRIIWQGLVLGAIITAADILFGWRRWSISYVVPLILLSVIIIIAVIEPVILNHKIEDYVVYLLVSCGFGLTPAIFIAAGWVQVLWPCIFCVAISMVTIAAVWLFAGKVTRREMRKRLHM